MKLICTTLIFFCLFAHANSNSHQPVQLILRHIESGGIGYNTGYTTLETLISADPCLWKVAPFFDARGHLFDNGTWAANGGIGLRSQLGERLYGINTYYDYRGTKHHHYHQASIGFETLGTLVDARINGYLPLGKKTSSPYDSEFGYFSGHYLFLSQKVEFAMKGIDTEVGFHLGSCNSWKFYTALGPYYFRGHDGPNAWGGKVRANVSYQDWLTFEIIESYDNVFHNNIQGQIGFSIPLGKKNTETRTEKIYCRKVQPVVRNEIVVLSHKHTYPIAINPLTHTPYFFVFVDNTSHSAGTYESPYPSLTLAQNNSLADQIIYVFPGNGTTTNMDEGITLQANQKLLGSGIAHQLQTGQGSITIPQLSASAPQITNNSLLGDGATLSTNNEISGITFTTTSGNAIAGTDPVNLTLTSCTFTACGQGDLGLYPISIQASSPFTATITNNTFTNNTDAGMIVKLLTGASSTQITMNNNQASNNTANSGTVGLLNIEAHDAVGTCELVMANNVCQNNECGLCGITDYDSPHEGSFTSFQGTFTGNTCTGSLNTQAIVFSTNADTCTLTIQENNLSNNTHGSILVQGGAAGTQSINHATIVIDSNQMNGGGNQGDAITISPSGDNLAITITNNSISDNIGTAFVSFINLPQPDTTLLIANNVITNNQNMANFNASGGISFDGFSALDALIEDNTFSNNAQGNSIGKYGSSFPMNPPGTSSVTFTNNQLTSSDTFEFDYFGDSPSTACLTITGNTSTTSPTYIFQQQSTGSCFLVPCDYNTKNTGDFTLSGVTSSSDCSGTACP